MCNSFGNLEWLFPFSIQNRYPRNQKENSTERLFALIPTKHIYTRTRTTLHAIASPFYAVRVARSYNHARRATYMLASSIVRCVGVMSFVPCTKITHGKSFHLAHSHSRPNAATSTTSRASVSAIYVLDRNPLRFHFDSTHLVSVCIDTFTREVLNLRHTFKLLSIV